MDITPYVDRLRADLLQAAEGAGPEVRQAAERLGYALGPASRLAMMEAISQAAAEITAEMPDGAVDVRLDGRDLAFVVDSTPAAARTPPAPPTQPGAPTSPEDDTNVARITLRLPESIKARAEEVAGRTGVSLNTWLVTIVRAATHEGIDVDLTSLPFLGGQKGNGARRMTGWL